MGEYNENVKAVTLIYKNILRRYSVEEIEDFFGISIKMAGCDKDVTLYNVYDKNGNLLLPMINGYWLIEMMERIGTGILPELRSKAQEDEETAVERAKEIVKQRKEKEPKVEMEQCRTCGAIYPKGSHFHGW